MLQLAAEVTRGTLPGDLYGCPADAVVASAEDLTCRDIVPRLLAAGADMARVKLVKIADRLDGEDVGGTLTLPEDLDGLMGRVAEQDARLLILDPLVSHLSAKVDSHRDQDMRRVLAR